MDRNVLYNRNNEALMICFMAPKEKRKFHSRLCREEYFAFDASICCSMLLTASIENISAITEVNNNGADMSLSLKFALQSISRGVELSLDLGLKISVFDISVYLRHSL